MQPSGYIELSDGLEFCLIGFRMNAVRGAHVYAKRVFDAGVGNHISHDGIFLNMNWSLPTPPEAEGIEEAGVGYRDGGTKPVRESLGAVMEITARVEGSRSKKMGNET